MNKKIGIFLVIFMAGSNAYAIQDIPLAVTTLAHPSLRQTPTASQLKKSNAYLHRGLQALGKQEYGRAVEEFKDSVQVAPQADNYKALGTGYYQLGDKAKAAWAYRQSIQLRPDAEVQALVDSLEGKDDPKEIFADKYQELRYSKLLGEGQQFEKQGKLDSAFGRYVQANQLHPGSQAREPLGRTGIAVVEQAVAAKNYPKGLKKVGQLRRIYRDAKDLSKREENYLARLDKAEQALAVASGEKKRSLEKASQSDEQRFDREIRKKGNEKVHIEVR